MTKDQPGSSSGPSKTNSPPVMNSEAPLSHSDDEDEVEDILCLAREARVKFLDHLLTKAVPPDSETPETAKI